MPEPLRHVALAALSLDPGLSGGPETYLRNLVPALAERHPRTRFTVITTRRGAAVLRDDGWTAFCSLVAMPADEGRRAERLVAEQLRLPVDARRRGVDLVHSLTSTAPLVKLGVPSVVTVHDATFLRIRTFGLGTTAAMGITMGLPAHRADGLIAVSADARDELASVLRIDPARFSVVPHGPGRAIAPAAAGGGAAVRERHGIPAGARMVLCVGAIRPHKNQELLVRAAPKLPEDCVVVLAGHAEPYVEQLRELAASTGAAERLRILPYLPDDELEALWADCACVAFPTRGEGFGLPVLEGMRRGVAVACSDLGVLREVGGDVPHYFDPADADGAAAAIVAAMADPTAGARGLERAEGFSWARAADGTYAAYERAVARARR